MIRTALFYAALVPSTGFFSILAVLLGRSRRGRAVIDWIHRNWARSLLAAAGVRVTVRGLEHLDRGGSQILVANHQSYFDVWALMAVVPASLRFVAKEEIARIPILGRAMEAGGHVFIDRDRARGAKDALRRAGRRMREEGLSLVLFPEGTRSADGELGRFLRGSFWLALETGAPLVPVAIDGGYRAYPRGSKRVTPGRITVCLAAPISSAEAGAAPRGMLTRDVRTVIEEMLRESGEGLPRAE